MKQRVLFFQNPKQAVYFALIVLLAIGCANIFSASMIKGGVGYLLRYAGFSLLGLGASWLVRRVGYRRLTDNGFLLLAYLALIVLLGAVFLWPPNNGAQRWLYLPGFSAQPSEFAKLLVIMLSSRVLGSLMQHGRKISLFHGPGAKVALMTLVVCGLVYKQPDLGTAAIILALMLGIFVLAGIGMGQVFLILGLGGAGAALTALASEYRRERLRVWLDPWLDAQDTGYQMVQSLLAIGSGGLTGTAWGQGTSKLAYLPESHTDFAFAVFCQENGFLGALVLVLVFALLGWALALIAARAKDETGFLLAAGCGLLLVGQAAANMAMVCGLLPVIGVPLSFISYGGSSLLVSLTALGLALSVYDEEERREREEAETADAYGVSRRRSALELLPPDRRR